MEENVRGDHREMGGSQLHGALAKEHAMSACSIEVKSPERTEDRGKVPLAVRRQVPRFVQGNPGAPRFDGRGIILDPHPRKRAVIRPDIDPARYRIRHKIDSAGHRRERQDWSRKDAAMSMFNTFGQTAETAGRKEGTLRKLDRLHKALRHQEPDRVPISDFFWGGFTRRWRKELGFAPSRR